MMTETEIRVMHYEDEVTGTVVVNFVCQLG